MEFDRIIEDFALSERLPERAIKAALDRPEDFVPAAVDMMEHWARDGALDETEEEALFLIVHVLGELGDARAFGPLMDLLRLPGGDIDEILGDAITETLPRILISLAGNDPARLTESVFDPKIDPFVRDAMLGAWTYFVLTGRVGREEALRFLSDFPAKAKEAGLRQGDHGWVSWVIAAAHLSFRELSTAVETAFAEGYFPKQKFFAVEIGAIDIGDFYRDLEEAENTADRAGWMDKHRYKPFEGTIAVLSKWYRYSEKYFQAQRTSAREDVYIAANPYKDVGRNDPCPCGSGKKFKKCCLQGERDTCELPAIYR